MQLAGILRSELHHFLWSHAELDWKTIQNWKKNNFSRKKNIQQTSKRRKTKNYCRRLPPVTAWYTPSTTMGRPRASRDVPCPYLKTELIEPLLNNALDKYPPILKLYIFIYLYSNIYTYTIRWIFMYLYTKSIQIEKKLVSWEKGYKQMFTALNSFEVLYLILIGRSKYSYQILTKQQCCWRVVKIGHKDLILTNSLKASGRF